MPKRGVFTRRQVQCSACTAKWYVAPQQVGTDRCPRCSAVVRLKGAAAAADASADRFAVANEDSDELPEDQSAGWILRRSDRADDQS